MSGAILFFVTSIALSVIVVVQLMQESKAKKEAEKVNAALEEQNKNKKKLEGTKLAEFTPVEKVESLQKTDLTEGTGAEITSTSDEITADYTGALAADGKIFQSSLDTGQPFTTTLDGVIKGWQEGLIGMKEGGKRRLVIPAEQAYGSQAQGNIPANSDLVFDITLHKVTKK
jgi:FKBP-type peptidyl-prolyl cis-trans isomerase